MTDTCQSRHVPYSFSAQLETYKSDLTLFNIRPCNYSWSPFSQPHLRGASGRAETAPCQSKVLKLESVCTFTELYKYAQIVGPQKQLKNSLLAPIYHDITFPRHLNVSNNFHVEKSFVLISGPHRTNQRRRWRATPCSGFPAKVTTAGRAEPVAL